MTMTQETTPQSPTSIPDPRFRFAAERTWLAWLRTGLALMGFGFVVARFGMFLRELAAAGHPVTGGHSTSWSLWIGTLLIALGVVVSLAASIENFRFMRRFERNEPYTPRTAALAMVVALVLALLGVLMAIHLIRIGI